MNRNAIDYIQEHVFRVAHDYTWFNGSLTIEGRDFWIDMSNRLRNIRSCT